jgi:hypothetical protein
MNSWTDCLTREQTHNHVWHDAVTSTDSFPTRVVGTDGRVVSTSHVRCQTEQICTDCGVVRASGTCVCDLPQAARCETRRAYLDETLSPLISRDSALRE